MSDLKQSDENEDCWRSASTCYDARDMSEEIRDYGEPEHRLIQRDSAENSHKTKDKKPFAWEYLGFAALMALGGVLGYVFAIYGMTGIFMLLIFGFIAFMGLAIVSMIFGLALMAG